MMRKVVVVAMLIRELSAMLVPVPITNPGEPRNKRDRLAIQPTTVWPDTT